jgi:nucleoside-diphosphate-sugar epimerase
MKILITGGNGYIAKSIYSTLCIKYDITLITRQDFDLTNYNATCNFFKNKHFDLVIHTATTGGNRLKKDNDSVIRENLLMYQNLLSNQDKFTKFISFGSGAELNNPISPYGISKQVIAESMFSKSDFLNIRIFAVFDENELPTRFIKGNILRRINGENMIVHEDKYMDFFYMADLITLVDYFINSKEWLYKEIECTYFETHKLTEIAQMINDLDDFKVSIELTKQSTGEPYAGVWRGLPIPLIGLKEGIKETYNKLKNDKTN